MIEKIKTKICKTTNQSLQPGIYFIKFKITFVKTGSEYWDGWLDSQCEKGKFIALENGAIYKEYVESNPVTFAAISYLHQLKTIDELPGRFDKSTQIMRTVDVLDRFWD